MLDSPGRSCPLAYRYGPAALATAPAAAADTLYVVGGLYGNAHALDAVEAMAAKEPLKTTICFNGDFNWFNVDDAGFLAVNDRVLAHRAILGNVEYELANFAADLGGDAGCGCAYPPQTDQALVERSNRIHARMNNTARRFPEVIGRLKTLPMFARFSVGAAQIGVVHGDAHSLAGWMFDASEIDQPSNREAIVHAFDQANVDIFASTHTCLPTLRRFVRPSGAGVVVNNGAAGMPNFHGQRSGLLTRISVQRSPHVSVHSVVHAGVHIDALPICYNTSQWDRAFLQNWPAGSDGHVSYWSRLQHGPGFRPWQAYLKS